MNLPAICQQPSGGHNPCLSQIGSGALPVETLPSFAIAIESAAGQDSDLRRLAMELRKLPRPVIGRIHDGRLLLDLRCLDCESLFLQQLPNSGMHCRVGGYSRSWTTVKPAWYSLDRNQYGPAGRRTTAGPDHRTRLRIWSSRATGPIGFIDVPGHHRFINTMISGISGIDLGMLVVAADDWAYACKRSNTCNFCACWV